jgi:outer membrane protein OmpA-like peptidoglycan-associated protein
MRNLAAFGLLAAFSAACATVMPPQDLLTARATYDRASQGPAAQLDPADLHTAKETLDAAEKSFVDNGDTQETRDTAYTADRRVQIAESRARAMQQEQEKAKIVADLSASQTATVRTTSAALGRADQQLAAQGQQLQTEVQRREDADKRAAQAAADLARIASVKQEPRGMVITLSGSVLFVSAKSDLLPQAQVKLVQVAKSLSEQDPTSKIVVEGYTDSQGGASYNQDLSQRRADAVRSYLVANGIAADRITAEGKGLNNPIADNGSAEGRANNRRVEIVVQPTAGTGN